MKMLSKNTISLECVLKEKEQAKEIWKFRSDPDVLKMSINQEKEDFESFFSTFLKSYFQLQELPPLFCLLDGKRIGYIRFRPYKKKGECEISIVLKKEYRGKGLGSFFLQKALQFASERGFFEYVAFIKSFNAPSKALFQKAGFVLEKAGDIERYRLKKRTRAPVFIIGEIGSNYCTGSLEGDRKRGRELIQVAAKAGCDAVKFQTFKTETTYAPYPGKSGYLEGQDIEELFDALSMPYERIEEFAGYAKEYGIEFMSTAFSEADFRAVDPFVERHKIASYENNHPHLIELAAKSKKPLLLSTGASSYEDIFHAVEYFRQCGGEDITLLQCAAQYPADKKAMNLYAIEFLRSAFHLPVGLSDHSPDPLVAPLSAVALGATVIEKHITLDRTLKGPDHCFAIEPDELSMMVNKIRQAEEMMGNFLKEVSLYEEELFLFAKRALQATKDIHEGDLYEEEKNIAILRPGNNIKGVSPWYIDQIEGKKAKRSIKAGEGVLEGDW